MLNIKHYVMAAAIMILSGPLLPGQPNELRALAETLSHDIIAAGKKTVAVVDFTDLQGNPTELGRYLSEELSVALARTHKGLEVVDRTHLKALLAENKLAATGLIDPATARKLGQIAGVDALVTGSMTPFSESVRIAVKVLATDTARILAADTADLPRTTTITELMGAGIGRTESHATAVQSDRPSAVTQTAQDSPTNPIVINNELNFELLGCQGNANSVICTFRITNRGPDRQVSLYCGLSYMTKAYDNFGNESLAKSCRLANSADTGSVQAMLVSGIPVQAAAVFPTVSASASGLSLINLVGAVTGSRRNGIAVSFRNTPIIR